MPMRSHYALPLTKLGCVLALCTPNLRGDNSRRDGSNYAVGDHVLNRRNVFKCAIVAVRPNLMTIGCIDQLRCNANTISGLAHATLKHVAHTEFTTDLAHIDRFALVGERRVT